MPEQKVVELDVALRGRILTGRNQKQYQVSHKIAEGGMAWVFQAQELASKELVALKVLFPQLGASSSIRERFIEEGNIQEHLEHPHIVRVYDIIDEGNVLGLALEWMDGGDLAEFLEMREGVPFSNEMIWSLFSPIVRGIQRAHQEDIVHRDFKPANVMLKWEDSFLIPKVADFGVAKVRQAAGSKTSTGSVLGTIKYMSPEQINDSKSVDGRSDIYSMGVALYQMATGHSPFVGNLESMIYAHIFKEPPLPSEYHPEIDPALEHLILKCLKKKPEERFQSCEELLTGLACLPRENSDISAEQTVTMHFGPMAQALQKSMPKGLSAELAHPPVGELPTQDLHDGSLTGSQQLRELSLTRPLGEDSLSGESETQAWSKVLLREEAPTSLARWAVIGVLLVALGVATGLWLFSNPTEKDNGKAATKAATKEVTKKAALAAAAGSAGRDVPKRPTPPSDAPLKKAPVAPRSAKTPCQSGAVRVCYPGPAGTEGKGLCRAGTQRCKAGAWTPCKGAVTPLDQERCNGKDDDCDGQIDEDVKEVGQRCGRRLGDCKMTGRWTCTRKRLRCRIQPPKGKSHIQLRTHTKGTTFTLRYRNRRRSLRGKTCLSIRRKTRVVVWAKGYQLCAFMLKPKTRTLRLRMKRSGGLDDSPNYCLRGQ